MLKVAKNKITLTRGDTAFFKVVLVDQSGKTYVPKEGDKIVFRLKSEATDEDPVILEKELLIDNTGAHLTLQEDDTKNLEFLTYRYEIEVITATGYHFTAIENSSFVVNPELEVHHG